MRTYQIERRHLAQSTTAVVQSTVAVAEMGEFIGRAIGSVARALGAQAISPAGPPFARYHRRSEGIFDVEVGFPTATEVSASGEVVASALPGGPAAVMTYVGPYDQMEGAYRALTEWVGEQGGVPAGDPWEVYLSDPAQEPDPATWRTDIVMPYLDVASEPR